MYRSLPTGIYRKMRRFVACLIKCGTNIIKAYLEHIKSSYMFCYAFFACLEGDVQVKLITLYLPETYIKALDQLVDERFYPNRAEAIRVAIRDLINAEVWGRGAVGD